MRSRWLLFQLIALLAIIVCTFPATGLAKEQFRISVDTILASRQGQGVDPQLKRHVGELQAMFNYTSYRLLSNERLSLKKGQSGTVSLPGGRRLKITPQRIRGKRAEIALQMMKKKRTVFQTQVQLLNHASLFVGGPKYKNGNLIFKISGDY